MKWNKRPIIFDHNRITRSYIGGQLLNEWRGMQAVVDGHDCEELLVTSIGAISEGKPAGYAISKLQLLAQTLGFVDGAAMTDVAEQLMKALWRPCECYRWPLCI